MPELTIPKASRRAILAAAPIAALIAVPGVTLAAEPAADPIFAALQAARRARAAYDEARAPYKAVREKHPEFGSGFTFTAKADGDSKMVHSIEQLNAWLGQKGPAHRADCKRTFAEVAAQTLGIEVTPIAGPSPEAMAAWEAERAAVVADFERARRAHDDFLQQHDMPRLYDAADKAGDALQAAEEALLAAVPTTPAGAVALLRFCVEAMDRYGDYREVEPAMLNALAVLEDERAGATLT